MNNAKNKLYKFDLHSHTTYSKHWFWGTDALNSPKSMINVARKKGLSGIAITDHQTVKGSLVGREYAKRFKDFTVIRGMEIHTKSGDVIALGIKENIPDNLPLDETIEKIHSLSGIGIAAHPFANFLVRKCVGVNAKKLDAIEVFNTCSCKKFQNKKALKLAEESNKPKTAGSDAHSIMDIGRAGIECNSTKEDDIIEEILRKNVKIFGTYMPFKNITMYIVMKFSRSLRYKILKPFWQKQVQLFL